jgi:hypothetical protein
MTQVTFATGRQQWIQAELLCLLCGRRLGQLFGRSERVGTRPAPFTVLRPVGPGQPSRRLAGTETFRCSTCGGPAVVDEVRDLTIYTDDGVDDENETPRPRRRGRPPKPWRSVVDPRLAELDPAG